MIQKLFFLTMFVLIHWSVASATFDSVENIQSSPMQKPIYNSNRATSAATTDSDVLKQLDGLVVYIEASDRYKGNWCAATDFMIDDASHKAPITLQVAAKDQIVEDIKFKWRLSYFGHPPKYIITFESMLFRNFYITLSTKENLFGPPVCVLREFGDPKSYPSVFGFHGENIKNYTADGTFKSMQLKSADDRGPYLIVGNSEPFHLKYATKSNSPQTWYIYTPKTADGYAYVDHIDNTGHNRDTEWSYTITIGISKTNGETITDSLEVSLGYEIQSAFGKFSASLKYSHTWQKQSSQTFSKTVSKTVKTTVAPGAKLVVTQLNGYYGDTFKVQADDIKFNDAETGETFASIEDFNKFQEWKKASAANKWNKE